MQPELRRGKVVHRESGVQRPASASICRSHYSARNSSNLREKRSSSTVGSWQTADWSSSTLITGNLHRLDRRWQGVVGGRPRFPGGSVWAAGATPFSEYSFTELL
jgi:hypothetical protein